MLTILASSNSTDVRLASPHWRRRGSCHSRLRWTYRRSVQIGSWCETHTASCPSAATRAACTAANIRCAITRYASPQDGVIGSRSTHQLRGLRNDPSPTRTFLPSKTLAASINRMSVVTSCPNCTAIGSAVSWARSSGLDTRWVTSQSASASAAALAICRPSSDRWKSGRRPYKILAGLCTSPCRSRWTVVLVVMLGPPCACARGPRSARSCGCSRSSRGRPGRRAQRRRDPLERRVVQRGRDEPRLERARRQIHAPGQHLVEERPERGHVLGPGTVVVGDIGVGEEDREH